jgi:hypothetical protein
MLLLESLPAALVFKEIALRELECVETVILDKEYMAQALLEQQGVLAQRQE